VAVKSQIEVELKFLVPPEARARLAAEMARGLSNVQRLSLRAMYLDTADRRLSKAGLAWRMRREGRRWIQTLKMSGHNALARFEHETIRPDARHDPLAHAGTPPGEKLIALLRRAHKEGLEPAVRFETDVRRTVRRIRTNGAVVEVAFDEGRLTAAGVSQRIREIEFELMGGSPSAMLALAERWRHRFGLIHDPRSKAERGHRLAEGSPFPPLRKANPPNYSDRAAGFEAFCAVVDECLAQITRNAIGLVEGDPSLRVDHVHQLRVGIRRLRSGLRSFQDWAPAPPAELVEGLRALFATLGLSRDNDVLASGVVAELAAVGAPALSLSRGLTSPDPAQVVRATATQQLLLAWIAWRAALTQLPAEHGEVDTLNGEAMDTESGLAAPQEHPSPSNDTSAFHRALAQRLRRWHSRFVADSRVFDELNEDGLHTLRKRIKRQRYAVEYFAPTLGRRQVDRYLKVLSAVQDQMGGLNDLFVARAQYQELVASDPAAWFALGWIAARVAAVRAETKTRLVQLAKAAPPRR